MLKCGCQIRAARGLLAWTRRDLATAAALHPNAIAYWEARDRIPVGHYREPHACRRIRDALAKAGVLTFTSPSPGVRIGSKAQFLDTYARVRARGNPRNITEPAAVTRQPEASKQ